MISWLYRWLPIFCGCHCRPDRSFFFRGRQFPVCARCTGMLLGFCVPIVGLILFLVWKDTKPKTAKTAGKGALISVIVGVVLYVLAIVLGLGAALSVGTYY